MITTFPPTSSGTNPPSSGTNPQEVIDIVNQNIASKVILEINYTEVNTFADLPLASSKPNETYIVKQASGTWFLGTQKKAGLYYSDGVTWNYMGNNVSIDDTITSNESVWSSSKVVASMPVVPTNVSSFTNDSGYVTSAYHDSTKSDTTHNHTLASLSEKSYNSLTDKPTIPTQVIVDTVLTDGSTNAISNNAVYDGLALKQDILVSGTNIKTINGGSILGSGDIVVSTSKSVDGGSASSVYTTEQLIDGGNANG